MANTFDADLAFSIMSATGITVLGNALAPLNVFTTDFSSDVVVPRSTVNVPVYTAASSVQTNPSNFETGDTTAENAQVVLNHYSKSFHITQQELNQGHKLENLIKINSQKFADGLINVAFANLTTTNYSASSVTTTSAADFEVSDLQTAWAEIKGSASQKGIVLLDSYYAKFLGTDKNSYDVTSGGAYGFGNGFYNASDFSAAVSGTKGFVCNPGAMAVATAVPAKTDLSGQIQSTTFQLPGGLTCQLNLWQSVGSRAVWGSLDLCFGVAVADTTALKIIKA